MSRPIDAEELLKAMDSHDKFGIDSHGYVRRINGNRYGDLDLVPYVHYKDMTDAVENMPTVEAIPKADYEARLKADLESMLVDLHLSIQELRGWSCSCSDRIIDDVDYLIGEKINALRGGEDGKA